MTHNEDELAAVVERNRLRRQASLPLLDVDAELRRLKKVRHEAEFERYVEQEYHRFSHLIAQRRGWIAKMGADSLIRQRLRAEWQRTHSPRG
jgi:ribosomal protein L32E